MSVGTRVLSNRFEVPAVLALGVEWVVLLISSVRNVQGTGELVQGIHYFTNALSIHSYLEVPGLTVTFQCNV